VLSLRPVLPRRPYLVKAGTGRLVILQSVKSLASQAASERDSLVRLQAPQSATGTLKSDGHDSEHTTEVPSRGESAEEAVKRITASVREGRGFSSASSNSWTQARSAGDAEQWKRVSDGDADADASSSLLAASLDVLGCPPRGLEVSDDDRTPVVIAACIGALLLPMKNPDSGSSGSRAGIEDDGAVSSAPPSSHIGAEWRGVDTEGLLRVPPTKSIVLETLQCACANGGEAIRFPAGGRRNDDDHTIDWVEPEGLKASPAAKRMMTLLRAGI